MCLILFISIRVFISVDIAIWLDGSPSELLDFRLQLQIHSVLFLKCQKTKDEFQLAHNVDILVALSGSYFRHELKASESYIHWILYIAGPIHIVIVRSVLL